MNPAQPSQPAQPLYCHDCGQPLEAGAQFCGNCGQAVVTVAADGTTQPTVAASVPGSLPASTLSEQEILEQIAAKVRALAQPFVQRAPTGHWYDLYFQPNQQYTDSTMAIKRIAKFLRRTKPDTPVTDATIDIVIRPGIMKPDWAVYSLYIETIDTTPQIYQFVDWTKPEGAEPPTDEELKQLAPHFLALLDGPLTDGNVQLPREAPVGPG